MPSVRKIYFSVLMAFFKYKNKFKMELNNVLEYHNNDIVLVFAEKHKITNEEAFIIFQETKKWLWLCNENYKLDYKIKKFI